MFYAKKAEMGVGTLIVFIAMLLVAAVAAGVLIQTAGSLQERALATGQQARAQISTNARVIEVSATDGRGGNLTDFQEIVKLSPGSDPIKLEQVIFTFNTKDYTSTLKYKGTNGICQKNNINGYNTWNVEEIDDDVTNGVNNYTLEEDLDDDGANDYVYVANETSLTFNLSSAGVINVQITDITNASETPVLLSVSSATIANASETFGYVTLAGYTYANYTISGNATFQITPYKKGQGYFVAIYEQEGTNHVPGNLQRGDIIRLCFEAPGPEIVEDEEVRLNFIPKIGTATLTQFVTPDVISTERVYLYP
ncbi:MAG: archaellin/type IV pilin N-terminal domain-containing protein [Candidatus Woesearchaeota archaeon]